MIEMVPGRPENACSGIFLFFSRLSLMPQGVSEGIGYFHAVICNPVP